MMAIVNRLVMPDVLASRWLNKLQPVAALGARWYVSWQFLKSGWLKLTTWDSTIYLIENEYHTPLLSPHVAAVAGTCGELFFPTLLVVGFMSRVGALGLSAVNVMAVISYSQVLLAEGSEAAFGQHILWGSILAFLSIYGPGAWSLDRFVKRSSV